MSMFGLNKREIELYVILLNEQLKIKEISKRLGLSERVVRRYIRDMFERKFIERKVVVGKRLAYKYLSVSPADVWKNIRTEVRKNISFFDENLAAELNDDNVLKPSKK
ncbi:MAG: HTH domain-containing protein, partial [Candidatus Aenigmarchaeota archaeon]|nr:HTH domain-containing protein [Candidatus Aenigmarchaeota archaeon]